MTHPNSEDSSLKNETFRPFTLSAYVCIWRVYFDYLQTQIVRSVLHLVNNSSSNQLQSKFNGQVQYFLSGKRLEDILSYNLLLSCYFPSIYHLLVDITKEASLTICYCRFPLGIFYNTSTIQVRFIVSLRFLWFDFIPLSDRQNLLLRWCQLTIH